jgi:phosphatidylglycerophosphate synthase
VNKPSHPFSYYLINGVTLYRLLSAPFIIILIFIGRYDIFKWMIAISFLTDSFDGYLARKYNVTSVMGAKLDSIADDLTVLAALIGLFVFKPDFVAQQKYLIILVLVLLALQTAYAFYKFKKATSYHTYLAKIAAVLQGAFLILYFFMKEPILPLFYTAAFCTALELIEEIIIVYLSPEWKTNVKGLYWVLKEKNVI